MDMVKSFIKHIVFPLMELCKGNRIRRNLECLRESQDFPAETLRAMQREKLVQLLLACVRDVPAYQTSVSLEAEIQEDPFRALAKFPILTKAAFRENADTYNNPKMPAEGRIANASGGSTSEPVRFFLDRYTVEYYEAARWRGLSWHGITPGTRNVMITGQAPNQDARVRKKHARRERYLKNRIGISAFDINRESMPAYVQKINKYKPEFLYGYVSALFGFAQLMEEKELWLDIPLRAVVTTSETLTDYQRETLARVFRCPVVNEYGAKDGGILAYSCPCGGLHETVENAVLEVVDPITLEPVPAGQSGVLLVTELHNFTMPRLRYRIGDQVALSGKTCACGMGLPVLENLDGREDDMFLTVDGRLVHAGIFCFLTCEMNAATKIQLVQHRPDYATLAIVRDTRATDEMVDAFIAEIQAVLPGTAIDVSFAEDIAPAPSGKYRYGIRAFPLDAYK